LAEALATKQKAWGSKAFAVAAKCAMALLGRKKNHGCGVVISMLCGRYHIILPSGYVTVRHGKSPFLTGKPSISICHLYHGYVK
jgi:hypothetical protein